MHVYALAEQPVLDAAEELNRQLGHPVSARRSRVVRPAEDILAGAKDDVSGERRPPKTANPEEQHWGRFIGDGRAIISHWDGGKADAVRREQVEAGPQNLFTQSTRAWPKSVILFKQPHCALHWPEADFLILARRRLLVLGT